MVVKNGIFNCPKGGRLAITEKAVNQIISGDFVNNLVFPICNKCDRCLMGIVGNPASKHVGKIFFSCSCDDKPLYIMCDNSATKGDQSNKIVSSLAEVYKKKFVNADSKFVPSKSFATRKIYSTQI
jgi:hypothetical protein